MVPRPPDDVLSNDSAAAREDLLRRMLRARDHMDRCYAQPLDLAAVAALAHVSPSYFGRCFRATFGETPHRYLQRRRIERAMFLLATGDRPVTEIARAVGFESLGTFSRTFAAVVGRPPRDYRAARPATTPAVPTCFSMSWSRPSEAARAVAAERAVSEKHAGPVCV